MKLAIGVMFAALVPAVYSYVIYKKEVPQ